VPPGAIERDRIDRRALAGLLALDALLLVVAWAALRSQPLTSVEAAHLDVAKGGLHASGVQLRAFGASPLYSVALHVWTSVFGTGAWAARSLSAVFSILTVPVAYVLGLRLGGRRVALALGIVFVVIPYNVAWATTVEPASLAVLLVFAVGLTLDRAIERPSLERLALVVVATAALAWTHEWAAAFLGAVLIVGGAAVLRRRRRTDDRHDGLGLALVAVLIGALAYVPLLVAKDPILTSEGFGVLRFRPANLLVVSLTAFHGEPAILMLFSVLLVVLGVFGVSRDTWHVRLDLRTVTDARPAALVLVVAMAIVSIVGLISWTRLAAVGAAIFLPMFAVLVALGITRCTGRAMTAVLAIFALLGAIAIGDVLTETRSDARRIVDVIAQTAKGPATVVVCPAAIGPAVAAAVPSDWHVVTWPGLDAPRPADALRSSGPGRQAAPTTIAAFRQASLDADRYVVVGTVDGVDSGPCAAAVDASGGNRLTLLRDSSEDDRGNESMRLYGPRRPTG
jgi:hypothetical protein